MPTFVYSYDSRVQMHNVIYELTPIPGTTQRASSIGILLLAARLASLVVKLTDIWARSEFFQSQCFSKPMTNTPVFCFQKNKGTDITVNFISYD
jgi:hypothetical protein